MTNIQSESFYQEANDMQEGWGETLRAIDVLKDKFENNENITLKEACYILWAEKFVNSSVYLKFQKAMEAHKRRKMPWPAWNGMFEDWSRRTIGVEQARA